MSEYEGTWKYSKPEFHQSQIQGDEGDRKAAVFTEPWLQPKPKPYVCSSTGVLKQKAASYLTQSFFFF